MIFLIKIMAEEELLFVQNGLVKKGLQILQNGLTQMGMTKKHLEVNALLTG